MGRGAGVGIFLCSGFSVGWLVTSRGETRACNDQLSQRTLRRGKKEGSREILPCGMTDVILCLFFLHGSRFKQSAWQSDLELSFLEENMFCL